MFGMGTTPMVQWDKGKCKCNHEIIRRWRDGEVSCDGYHNLGWKTWEKTQETTMDTKSRALTGSWQGG
jgi:hypothetical protein